MAMPSETKGQYSSDEEPVEEGDEDTGDEQLMGPLTTIFGSIAPQLVSHFGPSGQDTYRQVYKCQHCGDHLVGGAVIIGKHGGFTHKARCRMCGKKGNVHWSPENSKTMTEQLFGTPQGEVLLAAHAPIHKMDGKGFATTIKDFGKVLWKEFGPTIKDGIKDAIKDQVIPAVAERVGDKIRKRKTHDGGSLGFGVDDYSDDQLGGSLGFGVDDEMTGGGGPTIATTYLPTNPLEKRRNAVINSIASVGATETIRQLRDVLEGVKNFYKPVVQTDLNFAIALPKRSRGWWFRHKESVIGNPDADELIRQIADEPGGSLGFGVDDYSDDEVGGSLGWGVDSADSSDDESGEGIKKQTPAIIIEALTKQVAKLKKREAKLKKKLEELKVNGEKYQLRREKEILSRKKAALRREKEELDKKTREYNESKNKVNQKTVENVKQEAKKEVEVAKVEAEIAQTQAAEDITETAKETYQRLKKEIREQNKDYSEQEIEAKLENAKPHLQRIAKEHPGPETTVVGSSIHIKGKDEGKIEEYGGSLSDDDDSEGSTEIGGESDLEPVIDSENEDSDYESFTSEPSISTPLNETGNITTPPPTTPAIPQTGTGVKTAPVAMPMTPPTTPPKKSHHKLPPGKAKSPEIYPAMEIGQYAYKLFRDKRVEEVTAAGKRPAKMSVYNAEWRAATPEWKTSKTGLQVPYRKQADIWWEKEGKKLFEEKQAKWAAKKAAKEATPEETPETKK